MNEYQNMGKILIGGDFNSRCGSTSDYIEGVDEIGDRNHLDEYEDTY